MYRFLSDNMFYGLEIAPTRVFPNAPYDRLDAAKVFANNLKTYNLSITSMQSIWYGMTESIFGTKDERQKLVVYTKKAIDFAAAIDCPNIVFGCPKNRATPSEMTPDEYMPISYDFFGTIASYAYQKGVKLSIEPNPPIYNTNFINTTKEAFEFVKTIGSEGLKVNIDLGTMIHYGESVSLLNGNLPLVNHVHLSEPHLAPLKKRALHNELFEALRSLGYDKAISIEIGTQSNVDNIKNAVRYVKELCHDL